MLATFPATCKTFNTITKQQLFLLKIGEMVISAFEALLEALI